MAKYFNCFRSNKNDLATQIINVNNYNKQLKSIIDEINDRQNKLIIIIADQNEKIYKIETENSLLKEQLNNFIFYNNVSENEFGINKIKQIQSKSINKSDKYENKSEKLESSKNENKSDKAESSKKNKTRDKKLPPALPDEIDINNIDMKLSNNSIGQNDNAWKHLENGNVISLRYNKSNQDKKINKINSNKSNELVFLSETLNENELREVQLIATNKISKRNLII